MEEIKRVEKMTPLQAGKIIGMAQSKVRAGLRQGVLPFGVAIAPEKEGEKWTYNIIASKVYKYADIEDRINHNKNKRRRIIFSVYGKVKSCYFFISFTMPCAMVIAFRFCSSEPKM